MKITMYELLGMVKDGKAPKKIKYKDSIYEYYCYGDKKVIMDYICHHKKGENEWDSCLSSCINCEIFNVLNDEIEILDKIEEEKKIPEKEDELIYYNIQDFDDLKEYVEITTNDVFGKINKIINKQNEIIDYLKSKGE